MRLRSQMGIAFFLCLSTVTYTLLPQKEAIEKAKRVAFLDADPSWVNQKLAELTPDQKIDQLINLLIEPGKEDLRGELSYLGGALFKGFDTDSLSTEISSWDSTFSLPPLIGITESRFSPDQYYLPSHPGYGQLKSDSLLHLVAHVAATQLRRWGGNYLIQPAPAAQFSEDNLEAFHKRLHRISEAVQEQKVLFMLGDVNVYYPRMRDTLRRDSLTAIYKKSARKGLDGLLLNQDELEKVHPGSYRNSLIKIATKKNLAFEGLIFAPLKDSIENYSNWVELFIKSGADGLFARPNQVKDIREALRFALESGKWTYSDLNDRLRRVLLAKEWTREEMPRETEPTFTLKPDVPTAQSLNQRLERASITLIRNQDKLVPLRDLKRAAVHLLTIGDPMPELLAQMRFYGPVSNSHLDMGSADTLPEIKIRKYRRYDPIVIALNVEAFDSIQHKSFFKSLRTLAEKEKVLIVNFGKLEKLKAFSFFGNLMQVYHKHEFSQKLLGQGLYGGFAMDAYLPIEVSEELVYGFGTKTRKSRLAFSTPEEAGLDPLKLARIDTIVYEGMGNLAMPGCQVMVVKGGEIVYDRAFGYHTYARRRRVLKTDLYDIASITKVAATTVASMKMVDYRKLRLSDKLGRYFRNHEVVLDSIAGIDSLWVYRTPVIDSTAIDSQAAVAIVPVVFRSQPNVIIDSVKFGSDTTLVIKTLIGGKSVQRSRIFNIRIKDLLTHHSGLPAGLPIRDFVTYRRRGYGKYSKYFSPRKDDEHQIEVASRLFLRNDYLDSLWEKTKAIELDPFANYKYSDANFVLLQQAIDSINRYPIDSFLSEKIYKPMGLQYLGYKPKKRFRDVQIIPTERDRWRGQLLKGHVHDPTAALLGGVSGNAGLFSNAEDMAHLFQMLLQGGWYGDERHLKKETIFLFTRIQKGDRGYGFDMVGRGGNGFAAYKAPMGTFGHTGFTGTCVWVDPQNELIYIFLSNRVHPRASNWKLNELRIRQRIHEAIYEAMLDDHEQSIVDLTE
ncbi:MAG: serine hydrolase [Bacteroidia bacterium]|nr:serine hydrolase [Bacteroidia bacterium]